MDAHAQVGATEEGRVIPGGQEEASDANVCPARRLASSDGALEGRSESAFACDENEDAGK